MVPVLLAVGFAIAAGVLMLEILRVLRRRRATAVVEALDPALEAALAELAANAPKPRKQMETLAELIPPNKWCATDASFLEGLCDPSTKRVHESSIHRRAPHRADSSRPMASRPGELVSAELYGAAPALPGDGPDSTSERDPLPSQGELIELPFAKRDERPMFVEIDTRPPPPFESGERPSTEIDVAHLGPPQRDSDPMFSIEVDMDELLDTAESQALSVAEAGQLLAKAEEIKLIKSALDVLEDDPEPDTMERRAPHPNAIAASDVLADRFVEGDDEEDDLIDELIDTEVISEKDMAAEIARAVISDPGFDMRETTRNHNVMAPPPPASISELEETNPRRATG